jgi:hypothetical protein
MNEQNTERTSHRLYQLNDAQIQSVSGGEVKIIKEVTIPFVGTMMWFDNGRASFLCEDWTVIHSD